MGVILFADDHIFDSKRIENKIFDKFNKDGRFSILPINNLAILEKTVSSISTFKALILDWNFELPKDDDDDDDFRMPDENPYEFLKKNRIFSLVYVYSQANIDEEKRIELQKIYPGKIFFEIKNADNEPETEFQKILSGIKRFEDGNTHLNVPFVWSKVINLSTQSIFAELETADKLWIKELYYSSVRKIDKMTGEAKEVEVEPTVEVINLFQNLLSERLIQNTELLKSIRDYATQHYKENPTSEAIINLYTRLYYTSTLETDTVMTGDIYLIDTDCYGVVISPECDMMRLIKKNELVELLCFSINGFQIISSFCKDDDEIKRAYNQENSAIHLLPVFPFESGNNTALIDFRFSLKLIKGSYLESNKKNRRFKINSPYIQQLRQRYLAYIGRVGVPPIPDTLRFVK